MPNPKYCIAFANAHRDLTRAFAPADSDHPAFWEDCAARLLSYHLDTLRAPFTPTPLDPARHNTLPDRASWPTIKTPAPTPLNRHLAYAAHPALSAFSWAETYEDTYWHHLSNLLYHWAVTDAHSPTAYVLTGAQAGNAPTTVSAYLEHNALKAAKLIPAFFMCAPWYEPGSFPHTAPVDQSLIRYRARGKPAALNSMTSAKPGKYLTARYAHALTTTAIADLAAHFRTINASPTLQFARTPEEIARVYATGPYSCMAGSQGSNKANSEPGANLLHAYATEETAIAYLERDGKPNARAFVHLPTKRFSKIYGDETALRTALKAAGFKSFDFEIPCSVNSLRLRAVHSKTLRPALKALEDSGEPVLLLPYFDGCQLGYYDRATDTVVISHNPANHPKGTTPHALAGGPSIKSIPRDKSLPYFLNNGVYYIRSHAAASGRAAEHADSASSLGRLEEVRALVAATKSTTSASSLSKNAVVQDAR